MILIYRSDFMLKNIKKYLEKDIDLIFYFLFIHFFPFLFIILNNNIKNNVPILFDLKKATMATFNFFIAYLLLYFILRFVFKNNYRKILIFILTIILFLNATDLFLYANFSVQLTPELLNILFETNKNEAKEFILTFFNIRLSLIIFYILFSLVTFKFFYKLKFFKTFLFFSISLFFLVQFSNIDGNYYLRKKHIIKNIIHSYSRYRKEMIDLNNFLNNFENLTQNITSISNEQTEATYVLIIGESFTKYHSSLYGYQRNTNPNMKKLQEQGKLFTFEDVVSPHHFTRETLKKLVSTYAHDSNNSFENSMNIIDIMKKAGFKTYWISNQEDFAFRGAGLSAIANRADNVAFTENNYVQDRGEKIYDEAILPLLENALNDKSTQKKFIILHLFGSHAAYKYRYPENFITFKLDDLPEFFNDLQKKNKEIVNHYDNSLVYNDYIIGTIINKLMDTNSFILYLSDHGQTLYEDVNDIASPIPTKTLRSVEIPMIFWASKDYLELHPEIISNLKLALKKPYNSEDIIYTLIDLCNLTYSEQIPEKSIINKNFKPKKRIISSDNDIYEELKMKMR